jgi:ClpP class serine protease
MLLHTIINSTWLIDRQSAEAYIPLVSKMIQGEQVSFNDHSIKPYLVQRNMDAQEIDSSPSARGNADKSVMIIPLRGVLLKNDGICGQMGTESLMRLMRKADRMDNISGILLDIDSPGGEASNIETVANFIRQKVEKPVIAHTTGQAASAAYWIGAAADSFYAAQSTNLVGSIGAMLTFADFRGKLKQAGIKVEHIYASQSTQKNNEHREGLKGNYSPIRSKFLDPMAQSFIDGVKALRPHVSDPDVYRGGLYQASEAVTKGLIDGIKTFDQAIQAVGGFSPPVASSRRAMNYEAFEAYAHAVASESRFKTMNDLIVR